MGDAKKISAKRRERLVRECRVIAQPTRLTLKQYATDFFTRRGCSFDGCFYIPFKIGITEYLVFTKQTAK